MPVVVERVHRGRALAMLGELLPASAWAVICLNRPRPFGAYRCRLLRHVDATGSVLHVECRDQLFRWRGWMFVLPGPDPGTPQLHDALARQAMSGRSRTIHGPAELIRNVSRSAGGLPTASRGFMVIGPSELPAGDLPEWAVHEPAVRQARFRDLPALLRLTVPFEDRFVATPAQLLGYLLARIAAHRVFVAQVDDRLVGVATYRDAGQWLVGDHFRVVPSQRGQFWSSRIGLGALLMTGIRPLITDSHASPNDHSRDRSDLGFGHVEDQSFIQVPVRNRLAVRVTRRLTHFLLGSELPRWKSAGGERP